MTRILQFTLGALLLAGCSQPEDPTPKTINDQFRTNFTASCVAAAAKSGAPEGPSKQVCECASDKVLKEFGPETVSVPDEAADRILRECAKQL